MKGRPRKSSMEALSKVREDLAKIEALRLESPEVEPSQQPVILANKKEEVIDLREFTELRRIDNVLEKLYRTRMPAAVDCEDESLWAYKNAKALVTYLALADEGLNGDALGEPVAMHVADAIQLNLDIMRLAGKRLYSLHHAHDSRNS